MSGVSEVVGLVGGLLGVGLPIAQARRQHKEQISQAETLNDIAVAEAYSLHRQAIQYDLLAALREHSRDVWAQKNLTAQTLMIIDTLMFSCGFAIIIEGMPPTDSPSWVLHLFSFCIAGALGMLFISVWFAMKMQIRMAKYNVFDSDHVYRCGDTHVNFSEYYLCHCRVLTHWGFRLFYVGAFLLVASATVMLVQRFVSEFHTPSAGWLFVGVSAATVVAMVVLEFFLPANTRTAHVGGALGVAASKHVPDPRRKSSRGAGAAAGTGAGRSRKKGSGASSSSGSRMRKDKRRYPASMAMV